MINSDSLKKALLVGLLAHMVLAWFSIGFYQDDEHFQLLEFANFKLGRTPESVLPWEYETQMRPTVQPLLAMGVIVALEAIGADNPFAQTTFLRYLSLAFSILSLWIFIKAYRPPSTSGDWTKPAIWLTFLLWFSVFVHVRFSSENWSGNFFFLALGLYLLRERKGIGYLLIVGLLLGLSFLFRYQSVIFVAFFLLWSLLIKKEKLGAVLWMTVGVVLAVGGGFLLDCWFYGDTVLAPWNYFYFNIVQGRADGFGIEPFWYYFEQVFLFATPPFGLLIIAGFLYFWYRFPKDVLTWTGISFVLVHSLIGHKELRFLFPMVTMVPIVLLQGLNTFYQDRKHWSIWTQLQSWKKPLVRLFWVLNTIGILVLCFDIPKKKILMFEHVYNTYQEPVNFCYIRVNPYAEELPAVFYMREGLSFVEIQAIEELSMVADSSNAVTLFVTDHRMDDQFDALGLEYQRVYRWLPDWLNHFNFNNWIERGRVLRLYEIGESGDVSQ